MVTIEAVHQLFAPVYFHPDAIGSEVRAQIGGVDLVIALPFAPADLSHYPDGPWPQLQPPAMQPTLLKRAQASSGTVGERDWGSPVSIPGDLYQVRAFVVRVEAPDVETSRKLADRVRRALERWYDVVCRWLQALTEQRLSRSMAPIVFENRLSTTRFYGVDPAGSVYPARIKDAELFVTTYKTKAISFVDWERALSNASGGDDLPAEHRFLVDSMSALAAKDLRRAVLDAATATEIVAAKVLETKLRAATTSRQLAEFISDRYDTLGSIDTVLRALGVILDSKLSEAISGPRNKAIHQGVQPSRAVARSAYHVAAKIVHAHSPLPP